MQPLYAAVREGDLEQAKELLNDDPKLVFSKDDYGMTPLHYAALRGWKAVTELLLTNKADVDARDNIGQTPLHLAATSGRKEVAELLLAYNADVNAKFANGQTSLHLAEVNGHTDVAKLLRECAGRDRVQTNQEPISVKLALSTSPPTPPREAKPDTRGATIHDAARRGNTEMVRTLLRHDPKLVSIKNRAGETPLVAAVRKRRLDIVELLLSNGADVNVRDKHGSTPLHSASDSNSKKQIAALLLAKGAHVNAQTDHGETPYRIANMLGNQEIAALLLSKGADPNLGPQDMVSWMFSKRPKGDSRSPEDAEAQEQRARKLGAAGRKWGLVVGIVLPFCYAISPLNPNRGHLLSFEQDFYIAFFAIVVCPIVGYGIGHALGKK